MRECDPESRAERFSRIRCDEKRSLAAGRKSGGDTHRARRLSDATFADNDREAG
jgi:hypothetical protein